MQGELTVTLVDAKNIPVWGFPWQSNPYCRLTLGTQAVDSKREGETGGRGSFKNPTWNQEFQFLVEDGPNQYLKFTIYDSPYTGRTEVGSAKLSLENMPADGTLMASLPVELSEPGTEPQGMLRVRVSYRAFDDDVSIDSGTRLALESSAAAAATAGAPAAAITDVQSAAAASAAATVEASQGLEALAVAKAAAARAAARLRGRRSDDGEAEDSNRDGANAAAGGKADDGGLGMQQELSKDAGVEEVEGYVSQLVDAVKANRESVLADKLSQRAVTRVTAGDTAPRSGTGIGEIMRGARGNGAAAAAARDNGADAGAVEGAAARELVRRAESGSDAEASGDAGADAAPGQAPWGMDREIADLIAEVCFSPITFSPFCFPLTLSSILAPLPFSSQLLTSLPSPRYPILPSPLSLVAWCRRTQPVLVTCGFCLGHANRRRAPHAG